MNRVLSAEEILSVWEMGLAQHPVDRALTLLGLAHVDRSRMQLAQLSIGLRDGLLATMRGELFGAHAGLFAECPECGAELELELRLGDLFERRDFAPGDQHREQPTLRRQWEDYRVEFRPPSSADLAAALQAERPELELLHCCIQRLTRDDQPLTVSEENLPPLLRKLLEADILDADPNAEIRLQLGCPECDARFQENFDIAELLWSEFEGYAKALLYEIHLLARFYGWSERDILSMSAGRRHHYLELVRA